MKLKNALKAAVTAGAIVVAASGCSLYEVARWVDTDSNNQERQTSVVSLTEGNDGNTYARSIQSCYNPFSGGYRLAPGPWRQIIGTTSDTGAGTNNPQWYLYSALCTPDEVHYTGSTQFSP